MFPALRPSCWFIPSVIGELVSDPSPSETGSEGNQECVIGCIHGNLRSSVELATLGHPESDPETAMVTAATRWLGFSPIPTHPANDPAPPLFGQI
jgi:hypothetical protein